MGLFGFLKKKPIPKQELAINKLEAILLKKIPEPAVTYVLELWNKHPFSFSMPKTRTSCLGNYRYQYGKHTVSVNADLNTYAFLLTLIHEIAHQHVQINSSIFKKRVEPHGKLWKNTFSVLMAPVLEKENVFPEDLREILKIHMKNPAASSVRDPKLVAVMRNYDDNASNNVQNLSSLKYGTVFQFNKKTFKKIEDRRSRTLVEDTFTLKRYTIPSHAEIEIGEDFIAPETIKLKILGHLEIGSEFYFKKRKYKKIEDRRTRTLVEDILDRKMYTIPSRAKINIVEN